MSAVDIGRKRNGWQAVQFVVIVLAILVAVLILRADIRYVRAEVKTDMAALRAEVKTDMAALRTEVKDRHSRLRAEVGADVADLRADMETLHVDLTHTIETSLVRIDKSVGSINQSSGWINITRGREIGPTLHAIETSLVRIESKLGIGPPPRAPEPSAERQ